MEMLKFFVALVIGFLIIGNGIGIYFLVKGWGEVKEVHRNIREDIHNDLQGLLRKRG